MKVSGFTICRNAVKFEYPIVQSLRSLLPLVDELIVAVGDSEDETWDVVNGLGDPKIKAFRTVWDLTKHERGVVLSEQANLALERCTGDWAVFLQSDEILHEDDLDGIRARLRRHLDQATEGLSFKYVHFYGSYETVQDNPCYWYRREVRAVKLGKGVVSVDDAAGFKVRRGDRLLRLIRADAGAFVYHYGWARPPAPMVEKWRQMQRFYHEEPEAADLPDVSRIVEDQPYRDLGHLARFERAHPAVMRELAAAQEWPFDAGLERQPPRWLRYLRSFFDCPKLALRSAVSSGLLTWNTHVRSPKLR